MKDDMWWFCHWRGKKKGVQEEEIALRASTRLPTLKPQFHQPSSAPPTGTNQTLTFKPLDFSDWLFIQTLNATFGNS